MAFLSNEEINNIRSSVSIVDVISDYIPLTKKGKNYFGVCPFHDDHAPSMSVSETKQIYKCFSCGATGNVFNFVMDYEHISFIEAVGKIASKTGIDLNFTTKDKPKKNSNLYDIYELTNKLFQNNINTKQGAEAISYLKKRNINEELIKEFGIGLSLNKHDILTNLLLKKGYSYEEQLKSGLVVKNDYGYQDIYFNRIMFPLEDMFGRVVGFSGRRYDDVKEYKYINTMETEIFKKGEILYNYYRAKDIARRKQQIIVMEGFMDVIRAHSIGVKNVVATMGTALTKENVNNIKRMAKEVILCFDGDSAGFKATMSAIKEFEQANVIPKIVLLSDDLDPDDYIIKKGAESFLNLLKNPINVMDFKLRYLKQGKDFTNSVDVASYVNEVIKELNYLNDDVLKELTIQKLSEETNLSQDFIKSKIQTKEQKPQVIEKTTTTKYNKYEKAEQNLIYYMLKDPEVIKIYNRRITYMPTSKYRLLAREISYFYKQFGYINIADLISFIKDDKELIKTIGEIDSLDLKDNYTKEEIADYIKVIYEYSVVNEIKRLKNQMKLETDSIKKAELGKKIIELKMRSEDNDK